MSTNQHDQKNNAATSPNHAASHSSARDSSDDADLLAALEEALAEEDAAAASTEKSQSAKQQDAVAADAAQESDASASETDSASHKPTAESAAAATVVSVTESKATDATASTGANSAVASISVDTTAPASASEAARPADSVASTTPATPATDATMSGSDTAAAAAASNSVSVAASAADASVADDALAVDDDVDAAAAALEKQKDAESTADDATAAAVSLSTEAVDVASENAAAKQHGQGSAAAPDAASVEGHNALGVDVSGFLGVGIGAAVNTTNGLGYTMGHRTGIGGDNSIKHVNGKQFKLRDFLPELAKLDPQLEAKAEREYLSGFSQPANDMVLLRFLERLGANAQPPLNPAYLRQVMAALIPNASFSYLQEQYEKFLGLPHELRLPLIVELQNLAEKYPYLGINGEGSLSEFLHKDVTNAPQDVRDFFDKVMYAFCKHEFALAYVVEDIEKRIKPQVWEELVFYAYLLAQTSKEESDFYFYESLVKLQNFIQLFKLSRYSLTDSNTFIRGSLVLAPNETNMLVSGSHDQSVLGPWQQVYGRIATPLEESQLDSATVAVMDTRIKPEKEATHKAQAHGFTAKTLNLGQTRSNGDDVLYEAPAERDHKSFAAKLQQVLALQEEKAAQFESDLLLDAVDAEQGQSQRQSQSAAQAAAAAALSDAEKKAAVHPSENASLHLSIQDFPQQPQPKTPPLRVDLPCEYTTLPELFARKPCIYHFWYLDETLQYIISAGHSNMLLHLLNNIAYVLQHRAGMHHCHDTTAEFHPYISSVQEFILGQRALREGLNAMIEATNKLMDTQTIGMLVYELFCNLDEVDSSLGGDYNEAFSTFSRAQIEAAIHDGVYSEELKEWALHLFHQRAICNLLREHITLRYSPRTQQEQVYGANAESALVNLVAFYSKYHLNLERKHIIFAESASEHSDNGGGEHLSAVAAAQMAAAAQTRPNAWTDEDNVLAGSAGAGAASPAAAQAAAHAAAAVSAAAAAVAGQAAPAQAHAPAAAGVAGAADAAGAGAGMGASAEMAAQGANAGKGASEADAATTAAAAAVHANAGAAALADLHLVGDTGFVPVIPGMGAHSAFLIGRAYLFAELMPQNEFWSWTTLNYSSVAGHYIADSYLAQFFGPIFSPDLNPQGERMFILQNRALFSYHLGEEPLQAVSGPVNLFHSYPQYLQTITVDMGFKFWENIDPSFKELFAANPTLYRRPDDSKNKLLQPSFYGALLSNNLITLCTMLDHYPHLRERYQPQLAVILENLYDFMEHAYCPDGCLAVFRFLVSHMHDEPEQQQLAIRRYYVRQNLLTLLCEQVFAFGDRDLSYTFGRRINPELHHYHLAMMFLQVGMISPEYRTQGLQLLGDSLQSILGNFTPLLVPYMDIFYEAAVVVHNGEAISYLSEMKRVLHEGDDSELLALLGRRFNSNKVDGTVAHYYAQHDLKEQRLAHALEMVQLHQPQGFFEVYLCLKDVAGRLEEAHTYLLYAARLGISEAQAELEALELTQSFKPLPFVIYWRYLERLAQSNVQALLCLLYFASYGALMPMDSTVLMQLIEQHQRYFASSQLKRVLRDLGLWRASDLMPRNLLVFNNWFSFFQNEADGLRLNAEAMQGNFAYTHAFLELQERMGQWVLHEGITDTRVQKVIFKLLERLEHGSTNLERQVLFNWVRLREIPEFLADRLLEANDSLMMEHILDGVGCDFLTCAYNARLDHFSSCFVYDLPLSTITARQSHPMRHARYLQETVISAMNYGTLPLSLQSMFMCALHALRGSGRPFPLLFARMCRFIANNGNAMAKIMARSNMAVYEQQPYGEIYQRLIAGPRCRDFLTMAPNLGPAVLQGTTVQKLMEALRTHDIRNSFLIERRRRQGHNVSTVVSSAQAADRRIRTALNRSDPLSLYGSTGLVDGQEIVRDEQETNATTPDAAQQPPSSSTSGTAAHGSGGAQGTAAGAGAAAAGVTVDDSTAQADMLPASATLSEDGGQTSLMWGLEVSWSEVDSNEGHLDLHDFLPQAQALKESLLKAYNEGINTYTTEHYRDLVILCSLYGQGLGLLNSKLTLDEKRTGTDTFVSIKDLTLTLLRYGYFSPLGNLLRLHQNPELMLLHYQRAHAFDFSEDYARKEMELRAQLFQGKTQNWGTGTDFDHFKGFTAAATADVGTGDNGTTVTLKSQDLTAQGALPLALPRMVFGEIGYLDLGVHNEAEARTLEYWLKAYINYEYLLRLSGFGAISEVVVQSRNGWRFGYKPEAPQRSYAYLLAKDMLRGMPGAKERFLYYAQSHLFLYELFPDEFQEEPHLQTARKFVQEVLQLDINSDKFKEFSQDMNSEGFSEFESLRLEAQNGYVPGRQHYHGSRRMYDASCGYSFAISENLPISRGDFFILDGVEAVRARNQLQQLAATLDNLGQVDAEVRSKYFYTMSDKLLKRSKGVLEGVDIGGAAAQEDLERWHQGGKIDSWSGRWGPMYLRLTLERILGEDNIARFVDAKSDEHWLTHSFYQGQTWDKHQFLKLMPYVYCLLPYRLLQGLDATTKAQALTYINALNRLQASEAVGDSINGKGMGSGSGESTTLGAGIAAHGVAASNLSQGTAAEATAGATAASRTARATAAASTAAASALAGNAMAAGASMGSWGSRSQQAVAKLQAEITGESPVSPEHATLVAAAKLNNGSLYNTELWGLSFDQRLARWHRSRLELCLAIDREYTAFHEEFLRLRSYDSLYAEASYEINSFRWHLQRVQGSKNEVSTAKLHQAMAAWRAGAGTTSSSTSGAHHVPVAATVATAHAQQQAAKIAKAQGWPQDSVAVAADEAAITGTAATAAVQTAEPAAPAAVVSEGTRAPFELGFFDTGRNKNALSEYELQEEAQLWSDLQAGTEYNGSLFDTEQYDAVQLESARLHMRQYGQVFGDDNDTLYPYALPALQAKGSAEVIASDGAGGAGQGTTPSALSPRVRQLLIEKLHLDPQYLDDKTLAEALSSPELASLMGSAMANLRAAHTPRGTATLDLSGFTGGEDAAENSVVSKEEAATIFARLKSFLNDKLGVNTDHLTSSSKAAQTIEALANLNGMAAPAKDAATMDGSGSEGEKELKAYGGSHLVRDELDVPSHPLAKIINTIVTFDPAQERQFTRPQMFHEDDNPLHDLIFSAVNNLNDGQSYASQMAMARWLLQHLEEQGYFFGAADVVDSAFAVLLYDSFRMRFNREESIDNLTEATGEIMRQKLRNLYGDEHYAEALADDDNEYKQRFTQWLDLPDTASRDELGSVLGFWAESRLCYNLPYWSMLRYSESEVIYKHWLVMLDDTLSGAAFIDLFDTPELYLKTMPVQELVFQASRVYLGRLVRVLTAGIIHELSKLELTATKAVIHEQMAQSLSEKWEVELLAGRHSFSWDAYLKYVRNRGLEEKLERIEGFEEQVLQTAILLVKNLVFGFYESERQRKLHHDLIAADDPRRLVMPYQLFNAVRQDNSFHLSLERAYKYGDKTQVFVKYLPQQFVDFPLEQLQSHERNTGDPLVRNILQRSYAYTEGQAAMVLLHHTGADLGAEAMALAAPVLLTQQSIGSAFLGFGTWQTRSALVNMMRYPHGEWPFAREVYAIAVDEEYDSKAPREDADYRHKVALADGICQLYQYFPHVLVPQSFRLLGDFENQQSLLKYSDATMAYVKAHPHKEYQMWRPYQDIITLRQAELNGVFLEQADGWMVPEQARIAFISDQYQIEVENVDTFLKLVSKGALRMHLEAMQEEMDPDDAASWSEDEAAYDGVADDDDAYYEEEAHGADDVDADSAAADDDDDDDIDLSQLEMLDLEPVQREILWRYCKVNGIDPFDYKSVSMTLMKCYILECLDNNLDMGDCYPEPFDVNIAIAHMAKELQDLKDQQDASEAEEADYEDDAEVEPQHHAAPKGKGSDQGRK